MDAYGLGFDDGREDATYCCLGCLHHAVPDFETVAEEDDYFLGYETGYNSVAD